VNPVEDLVARYRGAKISRTQMIAALTAAGATAAGAAFLATAIDHSSTTPPSVPNGVISHQTHHAGPAATSQTAMHDAHLNAQTAR
jgi:hypothetical protein